MEYNSQRDHLVIPEYGRNIQKMAEYACTVEDREERNKLAKAIVAVMGQLNPHLRDINDFRHKLWDHLFIISNFKLDVDSPYPKPAPQDFKIKPQKLPYPTYNIKYRHFGKNIEKMIGEVKKISDPAAREHLTLLIANFMKQSYVNWNKDSVGDEIILNHLRELSKGELVAKPGLVLNHYTRVDQNRKQQQQKNKNNPQKHKKNNNHGHRKDRY